MLHKPSLRGCMCISARAPKHRCTGTAAPNWSFAAPLDLWSASGRGSERCVLTVRVGRVGSGQISIWSGREDPRRALGRNSWTVIHSPNPSLPGRQGYNALNAMDALASDNVCAVGTYIDAETRRYLTLVEHWNGLRWRLIPSPTRSRNLSTFLRHVLGLTTEPGPPSVRVC
jgi:hypothetical protein